MLSNENESFKSKNFSNKNLLNNHHNSVELNYIETNQKNISKKNNINSLIKNIKQIHLDSKEKNIENSSNKKKKKKKKKHYNSKTKLISLINHKSLIDSTELDEEEEEEEEEEINDDFIIEETTNDNKSEKNKILNNQEKKKISLNELLDSLRKKEKHINCNSNDEDIDDILFENVTWSSLDSQLQPIPIFVKTFNGNLIQLQVSLEDSIQVIIQGLSESVETCYITCYNLQFNGKIIDDYIILSDIPDIQPHSTFIMVEAPYSEKSAKYHVQILNELLSSASVLKMMDSPSFCIFPYLSKLIDNELILPKENILLEEDSLPLIDTSLKSIFPSINEDIQCIRSICFSGWNPPPGNRRLLGDLFYLEISLLEDKVIYVTASVDGFFVNETRGKQFNPQISSRYQLSHTLVGLLNQASSLFKKNFTNLLNKRFEKDPFEIYPVYFPVRPWISLSKLHDYDLNRAEGIYMPSSYNDGQFRDWNEEFQSAKELPGSNVRERILRDHAIIKVNNDFVEAATKGAIAVINKSVAPLNPMDPKPIQMYIHNNIFFSFAIDTENRYEEAEGRYTYTGANNDLKGVIVYNNANIEKLYTLATAIIDYRGYRVVAQSMIPGIFNPSTIVYNSTDFIKEPEFYRLLTEAGKILHISPHEVIDKNGNKVIIPCSLPTKGIIGTDGRRYVIDLCRITPQDANFKGPKNAMCILRPELITILNEINSSNGKEINLNPDTFVCSNLGGTEEQRKEDEKLVENASNFILETLIPNMIQEFTSLMCVPVDGQTLTTVMHHRGINMRYLGYIALLCSNWTFIQNLCIREMITRSAKHILRGILFETSTGNLAPTITYFLNCFLGSPSNIHLRGGKKKKKPKGISSTLSPSSLWSNISKMVQDRFQYKLPEDIRTKIAPLPTLRNLCQKMGIQIVARDYDFNSLEPFQVDDILDLFPVVKHSSPKTADGHDLLESGVTYLAQGKLDISFELLSEALVIFSQVYGPMHQATAICFSNMAMVLYQSGDPSEASIYQQKSVIINERIQGIDHHETAQSYGNLALFYHKMGKLKLALHYIRRAIYLGYITCGTSHPDNGTSFTNIGMILQDMGEINISLFYFLKALKCNELAIGPEHQIFTAAIYHAIATNYSLLQRWKEALDYERKNYSILIKVIEDKNDSRIEECNQLLQKYTENALVVARENKNQQQKNSKIKHKKGNN